MINGGGGSSSPDDLHASVGVAGLGPLKETGAGAVLLHLRLRPTTGVVCVCREHAPCELLRLPVDHVPPVLLVLDDDVLGADARVQVALRVVVELAVERVAQRVHAARVGAACHPRRGVALELLLLLLDGCRC